MALVKPKLGDDVLKYDESQTEAINEIMLKMNPIGTIYTSTESTNPSEFIGGTWEEYGKGRVLVGRDSSQTEFNAIGKTGGSKFLQKHSHKMEQVGDRRPVFLDVNTPSAGGGIVWANTGERYQYLGINATRAKEFGTGDSGNLQPYITVYRFRRTA